MQEHFLDYFRLIQESMVLSLCFYHTFPKRKRFWVIFGVTALVNTLFCVLFSWMASLNPFGGQTYRSHVMWIYLLLYLPLLAYCFFAFKMEWYKKVFVYVFCIMLRYGIRKLMLFILAIGGLIFSDPGMYTLYSTPWQSVFVYYPLYAFVFFYAYRFVESGNQNGNPLVITKSTTFLYLIFAVFNIFFALMEPAAYHYKLAYYILLLLVEVLMTILFFYIEYIINHLARLKMESEIEKEIISKDEKNFNKLQENMSIINVKSHDLRHQLRMLKEQNNIDNNWIKDAEDAIDSYDCTLNSGNHYLDTIITDSKMRCEKKKIQFSCMADGNKLNFLEPGDLISLFSNLIENAIEYETRVEDQDKRFISLVVLEQKGFLRIHIENYYKEDEGVIDRTTTKKDKINHGYGMKSIQNIALKYGGFTDFKIQNHLFQANVIFPAKAED